LTYNELRKDYLLNRWVVSATERARRPNDFVKPKTVQAKADTCPLCPGNEHMTPPAVLTYLRTERGTRKDREEGNFRFKTWLVRTVPNMFPAFTPPKNPSDAQNIMQNENFGKAIGHHEVLIETPNHNDHPPDTPLPQLINVIDAYKDRLIEISSKPYVKYVQIFRNHGVEAGASLSHPHSQIIAVPFLPTIPGEEMAASKTYFDHHGSCIFCDITNKEKQTERHILENDYFEVFAPYASVHPVEFWIVPKHHATNILDHSLDETHSFAQTLQTTLKALKVLVNDPPYNFGIHQAINEDSRGWYHWHVEVYPHLAIWAGFEKSTGMYINTITPETAAQELRKIIQT